ADQTRNQKRRVNFTKQDTTPETNEDGGIKPVIASEQDTQSKRSESIRRNQAAHLRCENAVVAAVTKHQHQLGHSQLNENDSENEKDPGALRKRFRLIDPE